jgi:hypothetical protein
VSRRATKEAWIQDRSEEVKERTRAALIANATQQMSNPNEALLESLCSAEAKVLARTFIKLWKWSGSLEEIFSVTPIERVEFDYPLCIGRADLVFFHRDGSVSVFEIAGPADLTSTLAAIDKLRMSVVQLRFSGVHGKVRKFIAATVRGKGSEHLYEASRAEGVEFYSFGTYAQQIDLLEKFAAEIENGNG